MPGFDRTGPRGEGPMTGGGRGFCYPGYRGARPYSFYGVGRGGRPWGGGRGRAWGGGRGYGRSRMFGPSETEPLNKDDEQVYLTDQLAALEDEMNEIKRRLEELDKEKEQK